MDWGGRLTISHPELRSDKQWMVATGEGVSFLQMKPLRGSSVDGPTPTHTLAVPSGFNWFEKEHMKLGGKRGERIGRLGGKRVAGDVPEMHYIPIQNPQTINLEKYPRLKRWSDIINVHNTEKKGPRSVKRFIHFS